MKHLVLITTILYCVAGIYFVYTALMHFFVIIANYFLGHNTPKGPAFGYSIAAAILALLTYQGYLIVFQSMDASWRKWILFSPLMILILYGLWALLIIISAGGKWN
jgi:hypothetical protein